MLIFQVLMNNLVKKGYMNEGLKKDLGGFYCKLCDDLASDGLSWLDHLNSDMHINLLEIKMKNKTVTVFEINEKQQQDQQLKFKNKLNRRQNQLKKSINSKKNNCQKKKTRQKYKIQQINFKNAAKCMINKN
ncbi:unnamed protein product [Paramecium octaurelia]|uniref:Uncharacterized protein n=1 Tax=Paramecium octaurelia TaxID=43137 RepID=A0A8S1TZL9_PAROT|nr:unnamed protein product [Paramecium octaurelia]